MRRTHRSRVLTGLTLAVSAVVLAGCGNASSEGPAQKSGTNPGAPEASAFLDQYTDNPTSLGLKTPLAKVPDSDRKVIYLQVPGPVSDVQNKALKVATAEMGWTYGAIDAGATPSSAVSAFKAAIARKPDGIVFAGYPAAVFTQQIAEAQKAGITIVSNATGDAKVDGVLADLGGRADEALFGKLAAAYFVAHAGPKERVLSINLSIFPVMSMFTDAFQKSVKEWCPSCKVDIVDQQLSDEGTKTPTNVVTYLQRHPEVKWVNFANGDLAQGVSAAIRTAGITDVRLIGEVPTQANVANIAAGQETAWVGYPVDVLGWRMVDLLARDFNGEDVAEAAATTLPLQLITQENVDGIAERDGYYLGVADYQDRFKALWKVN